MKNQHRNCREYDIAYGAFLFCGLSMLIISGLSYISMDSETAGVLGFLVFIPLSMASLAVMVIGIFFAIKLYHHWPLVILTLLSVLLVTEIFTEYGSSQFYNLVPIIYGIITCLFSFAWFGFLRDRSKNS